MNNHPWRIELAKLIFVLLFCLPLHEILNDWSLSFVIVLVGYTAFIIFKLYQVMNWLKKDMPSASTPHCTGVIDALVLQMQHYKKNVGKTHDESNIINQFTDIISKIPSAAVVLGNNNGIEWANYSALLLLGIDAQKDIGIKIDTLIRQSRFVQKINISDHKEFKMTSPVDENITLVIQIAELTDDRRLLFAHNLSANIENQRSRKTFIANASHELRTPLTVVAGYLEFMQSAPDLPKSLQQPVNKALKQSDNMRVLIEDLLVLSRLEAKDLEVGSLAIINVKQHLQGLLHSLRDSGKLEHHHIVTIAENDLFVEASQKELDSVCFNLINNALKYSDRGTEIKIIWEKMNKQKLKFSVVDQGIGIAPEHIAHLTERFYRADNEGRSRRVGGTGLGLSIVKHIVERHNGQLEIYSHVGEGSTFSIILPIKHNIQPPK